MDPDEYTYSEHLKRLGDHAEANAKPCHFCQVNHVESNLTKIKATHHLICWGCLTSMTLGQAIEYLKAGEDKVSVFANIKSGHTTSIFIFVRMKKPL